MKNIRDLQILFMASMVALVAFLGGIYYATAFIAERAGELCK